MENSIVSPGEITIGMYLTVYEVNYLDNKKKWSEANNFPMMLLPNPLELSDHAMYEKMKGITMKVVSIQHPYLAVMIMNDDKKPIVAMDIRKCVLMELSEHFVNKFTG